jgi:hypothetical protein
VSLTRFQALVARESLAEVYPTWGPYSGMAFTVVSILPVLGSDRLMIGVEGNGVATEYRLSDLEPSRHLLSLIEDGTYRQWDMTWNAVDSDGNCVSESLGERINYEPSDRRQCGICSQWTTHEQWLTHSHGMDK